MARRVSPPEAAELLKQGWRYVDVRSIPEFDEGHPQGAANVPLLHMQGGRMAPNPDFQRVMAANFPKDSQLVIGCKSGGRSAQAAALLEASGYTQVVDMRGGFGGERDSSEDDLARKNFGRLVQQSPDLAGPRTALAEIDLRHGCDEAAWPNFAWRFNAAPEELPRHLAMMAPDDRPKSWSGGKIRRRRLFLRAERNAMEQLLFAPWLADALDDARAVRAECDAKVLPLLQAAFPKARIAGAGTLTPADLVEDRAQIAASLADIVQAYGGKSAGGWLPVDRVQAASLRQRAQADRPNDRVIGLAWLPTGSALAGLEPFAPLFDVPGIRWIALPMGGMTPALSQLLSAPTLPLFYESTLTSHGLESIAGVLAALDLLISGEDVAATLAGAVGKPVWKIAGANAHWSWGTEGAASKWHPTARVIRGSQALEALIADLAQFVDGRG